MRARTSGTGAPRQGEKARSYEHTRRKDASITERPYVVRDGDNASPEHQALSREAASNELLRPPGAYGVLQCIYADFMEIGCGDFNQSEKKKWRQALKNAHRPRL
ncbi:hypothetical protein A2765_01000 [Candidatus Kaiserbacteria bacterium RIFCSPHIGHO2_01_FULL_56_24]|uniref:Uncharacterized protein n=1 Tax=Candidatus Kaiserbacteria bacterium RIFCSPHIGHO2_01_FULL_56_24 TaxID=1798487 RepID=A0A1F6DFC2_9BACT|nr:MAG: hypothetical protein A2765_01000 [Candidatus Kaiserbacteria bacterium RIFCSPHIGHO2_01_FULL_56_24]